MTLCLLETLWKPSLQHLWDSLIPLLYVVYLRVFLLPWLSASISIIRRLSAFLTKTFLFMEGCFLYHGSAIALASIAYVTCAWNYPLLDEQLSHIDKIIGFDWLRALVWIQNSGNAVLKKILSIAYNSIVIQPVFLIGYFSLLLNKKRIYESFWILFITLFITAILSGFFPALGQIGLYKLKPDFYLLNHALFKSIEHVTQIRLGNIPHGPINGIVVFPSFHAACAIIYAYAFRRTAFVGWIMLLLNILLLLATPLWGGHYIVDIVAGIFLAFVAIAIVKAWPALYGEGRESAIN